MKQLFPSILLLMSLAPYSFAEAAGMQPGLWEITTTMEMTGMPMKMPAQTVRHCYTQKELDQGKNSVPLSDDKNCQVKDYKSKGNSASWTVVCTGKDAMTGTGTMTFTPTSYTGKMRAKVKDGGETMDMTYSYAAKRIGNCK